MAEFLLSIHQLRCNNAAHGQTRTNSEEAAASVQKSNEELSSAHDALNEAIELQEDIEAEMDTADDAEQAALSERHQALDAQIEGLRQDFESSERHHIDNVTYWGY